MHVKLSDSTTDLLFEVKEFSENGIVNINDAAALIEFTSGRGDIKAFRELIFTAKYLQGLKNVLNKNVPIEQEAEANIRNEFQKNLEKFHRQLKAILKTSENEEFNKQFESTYISLTQEAMFNIMSLIDDLAFFKKYFNVIEKG
jgi:hypothetical protein